MAHVLNVLHRFVVGLVMSVVCITAICLLLPTIMRWMGFEEAADELRDVDMWDEIQQTWWQFVGGYAPAMANFGTSSASESMRASHPWVFSALSSFVWFLNHGGAIAIAVMQLWFTWADRGAWCIRKLSSLHQQWTRPSSIKHSTLQRLFQACTPVSAAY